MDEVTRKRLERLEEDLQRLPLQTPAPIVRKRELVTELREVLADAEIDDVTRSRIGKLIEALADECGV